MTPPVGPSRPIDAVDGETWAQLVDALCGEGDPAVRAAMERRLTDDPAFAAFAAPLLRAWRLPAPQPAWDSDANWAAIQRKAAPPAAPRTPPSAWRAWQAGVSWHPRRWRTPQWTAVAVTVLVLWVVQHTVRARLWPHSYYQGGVAGTTVQLPDHSVAVLAPGSYLGTAPGFPAATRTVYLVGDAHFTVAPDPRHPFVVQTLGVGAQVLGTQFHLHADTLPQIRVEVTQGKVALVVPDAAGHWRPLQVITAGQAVQIPMLASGMAHAGYTVAHAGVPLRVAARIEGALRHALIRTGAAAARQQNQSH